MLTIRCAWCKTIIGTKEAEADGISDGICGSCMKEHFPEHYESITKGKTQEEIDRLY